MKSTPRVFRRLAGSNSKTIADLDGLLSAIPLPVGAQGPALALGTWGPGDAWGLRSARWMGRSKSDRVSLVVFTQSVFSGEPGAESKLLIGDFAAMESTRLSSIQRAASRSLIGLGFVEEPLKGFDYPTLVRALESTR